MQCRSPEGAKVIASGPLSLPDEFNQPGRRDLDDAVFELLGVVDANRRRLLVDRLYNETASHFRRVRVVEIQKQEQRAKGGPRALPAEDLAADAWDAAELSDWRPLQQWLAEQTGPTQTFDIPAAGAASLTSATDMYDRNAIYFGTGRNAKRIDCESRGHAELIRRLSSLGLRGSVQVPRTEHACQGRLVLLEDRLQKARHIFEVLADSRGGDEKTRKEVIELLMHWFIFGRPRTETNVTS
jgi:hypothetical protein